VMASTFARQGEAASQAARRLADADVLVVAAPLYVDALPYPAILALKAADAARHPGQPQQRIAGIINCGFPEPEHTRFAFASLRAFAHTTGGRFAGGLPIGGGEFIHGQDLEAVGGMAAPLRAALDAAARALVAGGVIPPEVSRSLARPVMPPALYRAAGSMGWRFQAWANGLWPSSLKARPFDDLSEAEWQAETLRDGIKARPLRVVAKHPETDDAVTILFEDPAHDPLTYEAGQYITLDVVLDGAHVRRAYSLASIPDEPGLAITVKRVPGGVMSNHLHDVVAVGDVLRSHGPAGHFGTPDPAWRRVLMIAGGSGIVPLAAIARSVLRSNPEAQVTLIYGAASHARAIYAEMLAGLARTYAGRFVLHWVLEQPDSGITALLGCIDEAGCGALITTLDPTLQDAVLICGPDGMRANARAMLAARGGTEARVQEESFASPRKATCSDRTELARVLRDDGDAAFPVLPGQSLLDAALDAGLPIGFSCLTGGCGSCTVTVLEGIEHLSLDTPHGVSAADIANGVVPACITRLTGPVRFRIGQ